MQHLAPVGGVYQAGTLSGNPVATAAGLATLRLATPRGVRPPRPGRRAAAGRGRRCAGGRRRRRTSSSTRGNLFSVFFVSEDVTAVPDYATAAAAAHRPRTPRSSTAMLDSGVYSAAERVSRVGFFPPRTMMERMNRIVDALPARRRGRGTRLGIANEEAGWVRTGRSCIWCGTARCTTRPGLLYGRLPDYHLSELGREMAERVAEDLRGRDIVHLRCSPLERAQETMAPIAEALGLPVTTDGRVIEAANYLEGLKVSFARRAAPPEDLVALPQPVQADLG